MDGSDSSAQTLFKGLKALSASSFPKRCAMCGLTYTSVEEFIRKTQDVSGRSGLKQAMDDDDRQIVELFRNCTCGSTLMDCFNDRRDVSEAGLKRRELFSKLMEMLTAKGLSTETARSELLRLLRGQKSAILERIGIRTSVR